MRDKTDVVSRVAKLAYERTLEEDLVHQKAKVSQLESALKAYRDQAGASRALGQMVAEAVKAIEPFPRIAFKGGDDSAHPIADVQLLSDLHVGEKIRKEETEGFGEYDFATAQSRMRQLADKRLKWIATQRRSFEINDLYILGIGDYISGDIHQELLVTNEFPLPVQTANAGLLIAEFVARMAPHYKRVIFVGVGADNHSRLVKKPQAKQKSSNSMSFLVHTIAQAALSKHENVKFILAEGMKHLQDINGKKFLIEHGDTVKSWMSVPYYGLERSRAREATRRMGTEKAFDYIAIGHWHVPSVVSGNILVNGSLSGTSEYDHSASRHSEPSQVSFLIHPKWGIFNWTAWRFSR